ncbi:hypothetical protein Droror1_Dr00003825 [Drosera rotundifolia]
METGAGSPCGACKFLRRKCATNCVFAPYFCCEQGPARFATIHKVFGASNVSKLLQHLPVGDRCEAVVTIAYEAQARIRDPVYGCVAHIVALQQQVTCLQAQLMQLKTQLLATSNQIETHSSLENQWQQGDCNFYPGNQMFIHDSNNKYQVHFNNNGISSPDQSSVESIDQQSNDAVVLDHRDRFLDEYMFNNLQLQQTCSRKRPMDDGIGELEELALRMMRN